MDSLNTRLNDRVAFYKIENQFFFNVLGAKLCLDRESPEIEKMAGPDRECDDEQKYYYVPREHLKEVLIFHTIAIIIILCHWLSADNVIVFLSAEKPDQRERKLD